MTATMATVEGQLYSSKESTKAANNQTGQQPLESTLRTCIANSNTMLAILSIACERKSEPMLRAIASEHGSFEDEVRASADLDALPALNCFIKAIKLPTVIKAALENEVTKVQAGLAIALKDMGETELARSLVAPCDQKVPNYKIFTRYRNLHRLVATLLACSRISGLKQVTKKTEGFQANVPADFAAQYPGLKIPAELRLVGPHGVSVITSIPEFTKFYARNIGGRELCFQIQEDFLDNPARWPRLVTLVHELYSRSWPPYQANADKCDRSTGVFLENFFYEVTPAGVFASKSVMAFRIPFGRLKSAIAGLIAAQRQIETGQLKRFSIEVSGRVDSELIKWLGQGQTDGPDPVPDVEILYRFTLHSSQPYWITLKAARSYHSTKNRPISEYSAEDQVLINAISAHFLDPYNRKRQALLTDVRTEHYTDSQIAMWANPAMIESLSEYSELWNAWVSSQHRQIKDASSRQIRIAGHDEYLSASNESLSQFSARAHKLLREIPERQPYYPPAFFRLTPLEEKNFTENVLPQLFEIHLSERRRIAAELGSEVREARARDGYLGPVEGYQLPLEHALMDMVVNLRRRQAYSQKHVRGGDEKMAEAEIPREIGRRYDYPERFFGTNKILQILEEVKKRAEFNTPPIFGVFDPLSKNGIIEHPISELAAVRRKAMLQNWDRLREPVTESIAHILTALSARPHPIVEEVYGKFLELWWSDLYKQTAAIEREIAAVSGRYRSDNAKLFRTTATAGNKPEALKESGRTLKAKFELAHNTLVVRQERIIERGLSVAYALFPDKFAKFATRFDAALDRQRVKFVYAIGADQRPIFDLVVPFGDGEKRGSHSELLSGRAMYGGGEIEFTRGRGVFHSPEAWSAASQQPADEKWYLSELNDATGHYRVLANTLPYSRTVLFREFAKYEIETSRCIVVDTLARGLRVAGTGAYRF